MTATKTIDLDNGVLLIALQEDEVWNITWDERELGTVTPTHRYDKVVGAHGGITSRDVRDGWIADSPDGERFPSRSFDDAAVALYQCANDTEEEFA